MKVSIGYVALDFKSRCCTLDCKISKHHWNENKEKGQRLFVTLIMEAMYIYEGHSLKQKNRCPRIPRWILHYLAKFEDAVCILLLKKETWELLLLNLVFLWVYFFLINSKVVQEKLWHL